MLTYSGLSKDHTQIIISNLLIINLASVNIIFQKVKTKNKSPYMIGTYAFIRLKCNIINSSDTEPPDETELIGLIKIKINEDD